MRISSEKIGWLSVGFLLAWGMRKVAIPILAFGVGMITGALLVLAYKGAFL